MLTVEMLSEFPSLRAFDALAHDPFVVFIEPPSLDARILNQFALFSLMPSPSARLDDWLAAHPELCRRVIVPAELKWEVRDKLDQANITERVLYPGLDGLTRWLARYYAPRTGTVAASSPTDNPEERIRSNDGYDDREWDGRGELPQGAAPASEGALRDRARGPR